MHRVCGKINSMAQLTTIVRDPAILSGEPVFHGTRVPFKSLTDYLEHGRSLNEFLEDFPSVSREAAIAALEEARSSGVEIAMSSLTSKWISATPNSQHNFPSVALQDHS